MSPESFAAGFAGGAGVVVAAGLGVAGGAEFGLDATVELLQPLTAIATVVARNSNACFRFVIAASFSGPYHENRIMATRTTLFAISTGTARAKSRSPLDTIRSGTTRPRRELWRAPPFHHERARPNYRKSRAPGSIGRLPATSSRRRFDRSYP